MATDLPPDALMGKAPDPKPAPLAAEATPTGDGTISLTTAAADTAPPAEPPKSTATATVALLPPGYAGLRIKGTKKAAKLTAIADEFRPILGIKAGALVHCRVQPSGTFVSGDPHDTRYWPSDHSLHPATRWEWTTRDDGVQLGTAVPDPEGDGD
jgi:hypothetical protein